MEKFAHVIFASAVRRNASSGSAGRQGRRESAPRALQRLQALPTRQRRPRAGIGREARWRSLFLDQRRAGIRCTSPSLYRSRRAGLCRLSSPVSGRLPRESSLRSTCKGAPWAQTPRSPSTRVWSRLSAPVVRVRQRWPMRSRQAAMRRMDDSALRRSSCARVSILEDVARSTELGNRRTIGTTALGGRRDPVARIRAPGISRRNLWKICAPPMG